MRKDRLLFLPPKNQILQKYIKIYYLHQCQDPDFYQHITYYPNYTTTLNLYSNTQITSTKTCRTHHYSNRAGYLKLLVGKFDRSREIITHGPLNKITIVFNPLGFNNFIITPLGKCIKDHFSVFDCYGDKFDQILTKIFSEPDFNEQVKMLDQFFLSKFEPFREERLSKAVERILHTEEAIRVKQLATELNISRKTLLRLFRKHLSYSVEDYLSVVKFRKALINFQSNDRSLAEVAFDSNYYDQPDFNRHFKSKCGLNPRQLFANLQTIRKGLYWSRGRGKSGTNTKKA